MYLFPKNVVSNVTSTLETLKFLKIDNVWSASFLTSIARKIFCRCAKDLHWRKKMGEVSALRKNGQPSNDAVITSPNLLYRKSYMVMAILNLADMEGLKRHFYHFVCVYLVFRFLLYLEADKNNLTRRDVIPLFLQSDEGGISLASVEIFNKLGFELYFLIQIHH